MKRELHELVQGSPEWHAFRLTHHGASEAAAMLGLSRFTSRSELLRQKSTGIAPEVDAGKQRLYDAGHASEAAARPMAEEILGESLYPVTYSYGTLSASLDGLTIDGETAFEHKLWNVDLAAAVARVELPDEYQSQCQQIMLVTGAERVLFMVSDGTEANCVHMFVGPDPAWFERIQAGWAQFALDLAAYQHVEVLPGAVAAPTMQLPALSIQVQGSITLIDNLALFGEKLTAFIAGLDKNPSDDQAFADCEAAVKTLEKAQNALEAAEAGALAQTASIDEMRRTVALYAGQARQTRLMLEKLVKTRKEAIRFEIVGHGNAAFADHIVALNKRLGKPYMPAIAKDFQGAIRGKKTVASLKDAVDTELARAKIEANRIADQIQINLNTLRELAVDHAFLFADTAQIVLKEADDLTALVKVRIAEHAAAEAKRLEQEREKIRAEETEKLARKAEQERIREEKRLMDESMARRVEEERLSRTDQPAATPAAQAVQALTGSQPQEPAPAAAPVRLVLKSGAEWPSDTAIIHAVALHFSTDDATALEWLCAMFAKKAA